MFLANFQHNYSMYCNLIVLLHLSFLFSIHSKSILPFCLHVLNRQFNFIGLIQFSELTLILILKVGWPEDHICQFLMFQDLNFDPFAFSNFHRFLRLVYLKLGKDPFQMNGQVAKSG